MLKIYTALVGGALVASAAQAQDTAPVDTAAPASAVSVAGDAPSWAGLYVGIHGGYGFDGGDPVTNRGITQNNIDAINGRLRSDAYNQNRSGALGGGQVGFNLQNGNLVYGVEGDFSYMDQRGKNARSDYFGTDGRRTRLQNELQWMGSARARVGYTLGRGLIYATGGYAFGRVKGSAEFNDLNVAQVNYYGQHKYTAQGWTAGGGLEFRPFSEGMMSRVSIRLETDYYDLGKSRIVAGQTAARPGYYVLGVETKGYNAKFGINYAF